MNDGIRILPFLSASIAAHALVIGMLGAERLTLATAPTGAGHEVSVRLEAAAPARAAAVTPPPAPVPGPETLSDPAAATSQARATARAETVDTAEAATTTTAAAGDGGRDARPPRQADERPRAEPEQRRAEVEEAGDGTAPIRSNATRSEIRDAIVARLAKYFRYPRLAQRRGWQGTVVLSVRILSDGRLSDIRVKQSSGRALLDRSATESLARVKRIPQLADRIGANGLALEIPVTYRLEAA